MTQGHYSKSDHPVAVRRLELGYTRTQLGKAAGISPETIAAWEKGWRSTRRAPAEIIVRVAKILKCKPEDLFPEVKGEGK